MCGPPKSTICELCLPLPVTPSGRRNSIMRRRRSQVPGSSISTDPYALIVWMCSTQKCLFCELYLPLTGTPRGRCNYELRRRRWLARAYIVHLIFTHHLSGCLAQQSVYFANYAFQQTATLSRRRTSVTAASERASKGFILFP